MGPIAETADPRRRHRRDDGPHLLRYRYACLSWAVKWEYLDGNPALKQRAKDELPEPSAGETADARFWSTEERHAFCRFVDRRAEQAVDKLGLGAVAELRDRALVYLLAYSGARTAEVLRDSNDARRDGLRWADVDLEDGVLTVLGKSQAEERVQLPSQARPALARLETALAPPSDDWPVIPTLHGPTFYGCPRALRVHPRRTGGRRRTARRR